VNAPELARFERRVVVLAAAAAAAAAMTPGGGAPMAAGVCGGALLAGVSYWAIKRGVTGLTEASAAAPDARRRPRGGAVFLLRYALLAGMAYVMIARLRLHPMGLLAGASVVPLAAVIEAIRQIRPIRK
jgi:hypothetical protein